MADLKTLAKPVLAAVLAIAGAVLAVEGGYVNDPRDPGGETNHGVTKAVAVADGYTGPMRQLGRDRAQEILISQYIVKPGFLPLVERSAPVARETVDSAYNTGPARPSCWLQISLNALNNDGRDYPPIMEDCRVGPATIAAFDGLRRRRGDARACSLVIKLMDAQQAMHYLTLARGNARYRAFMVGWTDHRIGNVDLRTCGSATP